MNEIYIYIDDDHEDYFVFSELRLAMNEGWPEDEEWIEEEEGEWRRGEYCRILRRGIDET